MLIPHQHHHHLRDLRLWLSARMFHCVYSLISFFPGIVTLLCCVTSCFITVSQLFYLLQGVNVDFPPNKLKQGFGEHALFVLDHLADAALKNTSFTWKK